ALHGNQRRPPVRKRLLLLVLITNESHVRRQRVLSLASRPACKAARAPLQVDEHSVASHHAPTFLTVTVACERSGAPNPAVACGSTNNSGDNPSSCSTAARGRNTAPG